MFYEVINAWSESRKCRILSSKKIKICRNYDPNLAGESVIYTQLFCETIALIFGGRKWFANTRAVLFERKENSTLFADTKALLRGERGLFANTRATIQRLFYSSKESLEDEDNDCQI